MKRKKKISLPCEIIHACALLHPHRFAAFIGRSSPEVQVQHEVLQSRALEWHSLRGAPGGEGEHAQRVASCCDHITVVRLDKSGKGKIRKDYGGTTE